MTVVVTVVELLLVPRSEYVVPPLEEWTLESLETPPSVVLGPDEE